MTNQNQPKVEDIKDNSEEMKVIKFSLNKKTFEIDVNNPSFDEVIKCLPKYLKEEIVIEVPEQGDLFDSQEFNNILTDAINELKAELLLVTEEFDLSFTEMENLKQSLRIENPSIVID